MGCGTTYASCHPDSAMGAVAATLAKQMGESGSSCS